MRQTLVTHPENKRYLEQAVGSGVGVRGTDLYGLPIEFLPTMPPRNIKRVWMAPFSDRFVEYGPEDEEWMRPLGLGRIVEVDGGPLFCLIQDPAWSGRVAAIYGPAVFKSA